MIELSLIYDGQGRFACATRHDFELATAELEQGQTIRAKLTTPRSLEQHRWVFSLFQAAFDNQRAGPKFPTSEHLRKWLLCRVGHCEVTTMQPEAMTKATMRWLRNKFALCFEWDGDHIYIKEAKSISFKACDADAMTKIANDVVDVICAEIVPGTTRNYWEPYLVNADAQKQQERADRPAENAWAGIQGNRRASRKHSK